MDLLKTPSLQSLLDSDLESVSSLQCLDIDVEELDEIEYALPASEAPTLAEVLSAEDGEEHSKEPLPEPAMCSALQVDFLQAVSQQLTHAQERSSAGASTALSISENGRIAVGTAHGNVLAFQDQILRWVCNNNIDRGAVSCLSYNLEGDRILVGFARGLICQYESGHGVILRRITLGGELWGILRVTWAGVTGLALDTGGSVWLLKFSRPLGVRSTKTSCLFSGARGEVVAMAPLDSRVLALATLSRVIVVAGGRAAGAKLDGALDTLPVLHWAGGDERTLLCARGPALQWLRVDVTGVDISLKPMRRVRLRSAPLWIGCVGNGLAIVDADENLRLWGDDYDNALDLSHVEPVYASAFFKGVWTDGRVSAGMRAAGGGALGGVEARNGALVLLGRRGVLRVRAREPRERARALLNAGEYMRALSLLRDAPEAEGCRLAREFALELAERPYLFDDDKIAEETVKMCIKYNLSAELWGVVWERCNGGAGLARALGAALVRGSLTAPGPERSQALLERLADTEPELLERVVAALPLTALDPHRATVFARERHLWRAVGAIAATLGGCVGALTALPVYVSLTCGGGVECTCAGPALLLAAADGLAGRGVAGRQLPDHARPSARHDALQALLKPQIRGGVEVDCPLRVLVKHEARAAVQLLEQSWPHPPFVGPLGKQNRLRVVRELLAVADALRDEDLIDIVEFVVAQLCSGKLSAERELRAATVALAARCHGERADRALLTLGEVERTVVERRPRLAWRSAAALRAHSAAFTHFLAIVDVSRRDRDELYAYIHASLEEGDATFPEALRECLPNIAALEPARAARLLDLHFPEDTAAVLAACDFNTTAALADVLLEAGTLRSDAAAVFFRVLCERDPADAKDFLVRRAAGLVQPDDALRAARDCDAKEVLPVCLEASGDVSGALQALLDQRSAERDVSLRTQLEADACALCVRAADTEMWRRLCADGVRLSPGALLAALGHLPAAELAGGAAGASAARAALAWCSTEVRCWAAARQLAAREAAASARVARRSAGRACAVHAAQCVACNSALAAEGAAAVRVCLHGVQARHVGCAAAATTCLYCGSSPLSTVSLPPRLPRVPQPAAPHDLQLVAPPRPDLEGLV